MNKLFQFSQALTLRLLLALAAAGLTPVWAEQGPGFDEGRKAYLRGDLTTAIDIWESLAEQGDAAAQFSLGTLYYSGEGVALDYSKASYWFHKAAEQGYAAAQFNLGNAYKRGEGVGKSDALAVSWWRRAADQDFVLAQYNLASAYVDGAGVEQDLEQAISLYRAAAGHGHPGARDMLAKLENAIGQADGTTACMAWLKRHQAMTYTLQLLSASQREGPAQLAQKHGLQDYAICSYQAKGRTVYALLVGAYPDEAAAGKAAAGLPPGLGTGKPWIRKLNAISQRVQQATPGQ